MTLKVRDLSKDHTLVLAGKRMVSAHSHFDTAGTALQQVAKEFPEIDPEHLIALWVGINCKDREGVKD